MTKKALKLLYLSISAVLCTLCFIVFVKAATVTLQVTIAPYQIAASAGANGSISPSGSVAASAGSSRTFTITPDTGYHIDSVSVDGAPVGAVGAYTFSNITANHSISVSFAINTYTVTVEQSGVGSGTFDQTSPVTANYNSNVSVTATANPDSIFAGWSGCDTVNASICYINGLNADRTVTASFSLVEVVVGTHQLTINKAGTGDGVLSMASGTVESGSSQSITATASAGSYFRSWQGCDSVDGGVCTLSNIVSDKSVTASFELIPAGTITINAGAAKTNQTVLTLNLTKNSVVTQMMLSEAANFAGGEWETAAVTKTYQLLSEGDGTKTICLKFKDQYNRESTTQSDTILLDRAAPAAPTNLTATSGNNSISLSWDNPTDSDFQRIAIFRGLTADFVPDLLTNKIGNTTLASEATYNDTTAVASQTYYYKLKAIDDADNYSPASIVVLGILDTTLPTAPNRPTVVEKVNTLGSTEYVNRRSLTLSWPTVADSAKYLIYVGSTSGKSDVLNAVEVTTTTFGYTFANDGRYFIRLRSADAEGKLSAYSPELTLWVDIVAPVASPTLSVIDASDRLKGDYRNTVSFDLPTEAGSGVFGYILKKNGVAISTNSFGFTDGIIIENGKGTITVAVDPGLNTFTLQVYDNARNTSEIISSQFTTERITQIKNLEISGFTAVSSDPVDGKVDVFLSWKTNMASNSRVEYGETVEYGMKSGLDERLTLSHNLSLKNLSAGTEYHFRAISRDEFGNEALSLDLILLTKGSRLDTAANSIAEKSLEIIESPAAPAATSAAAASMTALATAAIPVANALSLLSFSEYLRSILFSIISLTTGQRKRKEWGKVIEAGTKMPLPQVKLELVKIERGIDDLLHEREVYQTTYSDQTGKYAFIATPGLYKIRTHKDSYRLISTENSYRPDMIIQIKNIKDSLIVPNIIMAMSEEAIREKATFLRNFNTVERILNALSLVFLVIGTATIFFNLYQHPKDTVIIVLACVYPILWYVNLKAILKVSPFGKVIDMINRKNVDVALVRIFDSATGRLVRTTATDEEGSYKTLVSKGKYKVFVAKSGYQQEEPVLLNATEELRAVNKTIPVKKQG
jgi:hypothetical protein